MFSKLNKIQKEKLRSIQKEICKKIILNDEFSKPIKIIAGFDLAFSNDKAFVAGIVMNYKKFDIIEMKIVKTKLSFPYVPTFLTFREGPPILKVYKKLKTKPDIIIINGQGIAHPIRCGIASHVGVLLDLPTIGVAQKKLCGEFGEPKQVGYYKTIIYESKRIGYAYKSKENCKPIFVSPGHKVSLRTSLKIVISCIREYKLPLPLRMAHIYANKMKRKYSEV
jgi:deoxyribonuclease V